VSDKVKRVWRVGESPVSLCFLYGPLGMIEATLYCPGCGEYAMTDTCGKDLVYECACGARLRLRLEPTLEELEPDA